MAVGVGPRHRLPIGLVLFYFVYLMMHNSLTSATVFLIVDKNASMSFEDIAANFAPEVKASGICGKLYAAEPIDACSNLTTVVKQGGNYSSPFALIIRGGCSFEEKVRRAQLAGFKAAIVYDNRDGGGLVAMAGNSAGIRIPAVFVSQASGEKLNKYAGLGNMEIWIIPSFENSAWSIVAVSFISLLAMSAVLATCFFIRRHRIRHEITQPSAREFHGMSSRLVKAMPSLVFTAVVEDNCTASTCAICLDDYTVGDKLRVLPCRHKFHALCVDSWLTTWRTFCPMCKRDVRTSTGDPAASETTPLLSSSPASVASSALSWLGTSLQSSSAIPIGPPSPQSHSASRNHSLSLTPEIPRSQPPYYPRNMSSSHRSPVSHLSSPVSIGYPSMSPLNARYISAYIRSPRNASSGYLGVSCRPPNGLHHSESAASFSPSGYPGGSGRPPNGLHHSESAASFSPFASTHSLPGC